MRCDCCNISKYPVYCLVTNGFIDNGTNALFGIDPRTWRCLPQTGIALLKVRQTIPATANGLVVALAVPNVSTVTTVRDNTGNTVTSIPLVDVNNATFTGAEFATDTERLVYFDKCKGLIRVLDCCRLATAAA